MNCKNCGKKVYANEICNCGEQAPIPHKKAVAVNSVICTIILVLSVIAFIMTVSFRNIVNNNLLVKTVENVDLCSLEVEQDGKDIKLNQYIHDEFIEDERITVENVDNILNAPFIKDFIIEKIEGYQDFFMDRGEMVYITSDDIINLIDENSELLYNEAGLNFLGPDKEDLKNDLSGLDSFAEFCSDYMTNWFTSGLVQNYFSLLFVNFLEILFVVILIQWLVVYKLNGRRMRYALRKYSISTIVPSAVIFLASLSLLLHGKKSVAGALTSEIRSSFIISSAIVLAVGVLLLLISILLIKKGQDKPSETESTDVIVESTETDEIVAVKEAVEEKKSETENNNTAAPSGEYCMQCGYKNKENSSFCSQCGTKLK